MTITHSARASRLGLLFTTVALGIALIASAWISYRGAHDAAAALSRGQADLIEASVRDALMQRDIPVDDAFLASILEANGEAGLRFIALFDTTSGVAARAGEPTAEPRAPEPGAFGGPGSVQPHNDNRVRVYFPRPPSLSDFRVSDSLRAAGQPDARSRQGGRGPQRRWVLLEIEPVLASGLQSRAARSLVLSIAGATILTLAALLFWKTSEQYQQARLRLEEQRRLSVLGEMSAVLAHEIRNPLASLKGNAQLLAEKLEPESKERARADRVISEATRLEALTSDLLDFARSAPLRLETVSPVEVLTQSMDDVAEGAFDVDASAAPALWTLDASRIRQTLVNVLQNALQAAPGTTPRVRVAEDRQGLIYEVRDYGPGLPDGAAERIFDPFFTTRTNGTGLGLAVARRVAEAHGGRVFARNHVAGGAVFTIELPRS